MFIYIRHLKVTAMKVGNQMFEPIVYLEIRLVANEIRANTTLLPYLQEVS
jgi:hypothetical protein